MSKTINKIVWEVFIEKTMGQDKSDLYTDRIKDFSEDMCYITYRNIMERLNSGETYDDIRFEEVIPKEIRFDYREGGEKDYR